MLEWTGERFIPREGGTQLHYEHIHRYELALQFSSGKRVLDYGSGEGYGTALLARVAKSVLGVDIDLAAIVHAREVYGSNSEARFELLTDHRIPAEDASFDLITCFEVIEHVPNPFEVIAELSRLLSRDGILLISTPNKAEYSDANNYKNEFHVKEFYVEEFREFLASHFAAVDFLGQRIVAGSMLFDLDKRSSSLELISESPDNQRERIETVGLLAPTYVVAACSHQKRHRIRGSYFISQSDALSKELNHAVPRPVVDKVLADMDEERSAVRAQLDRDAEEITSLRNIILGMQELQRSLGEGQEAPRPSLWSRLASPFLRPNNRR